jgi:hypothetical protein
MKKVETKYGEVELRVVMTDIDGTNLDEGIEVTLNGELLGQVIEIDFDDLTISDVEEIVEYFI